MNEITRRSDLGNVNKIAQEGMRLFDFFVAINKTGNLRIANTDPASLAYFINKCPEYSYNQQNGVVSFEIEATDPNKTTSSLYLRRNKDNLMADVYLKEGLKSYWSIIDINVNSFSSASGSGMVDSRLVSLNIKGMLSNIDCNVTLDVNGRLRVNGDNGKLRLQSFF